MFCNNQWLGFMAGARFLSTQACSPSFPKPCVNEILATLCQQFLSIHVIPRASLCSSILGRNLLRLCKRCCVLGIHIEAYIGMHCV